jgi:hypothetical protein
MCVPPLRHLASYMPRGFLENLRSPSSISHPQGQASITPFLAFWLKISRLANFSGVVDFTAE